MKSRGQGRGADETRRRVERLELELELYRRLYRGALETLKAVRRQEAARRTTLS